MKLSLKLTIAFWLILVLLDLLSRLVIPPGYRELFALSTSFVLLGVMFAWFLADARENRFSVSYGLKIMVVALPFVTLPYYLFRYKGYQRALISLGKFGLILLFYYLGFELLGYIRGTA